MIRAVIFDLDDTLYDEIDYCKSGFNAVAQFLNQSYPNHPRQAIYQTMVDYFDQGHRGDIFNRTLKNLGVEIDQNAIETLVTVYREHRPTIPVPAETLEVLELLKPQYQLAILTDGYLPAQKYKLQALNIAHFFDAVVFTEELGREFWKPNPAGFEQIIEKFRISTEQAAYIGDNEQKDFIGPNQIGMISIKLEKPNAIHSEKSAQPINKPKYRIKNLIELPALLKSI